MSNFFDRSVRSRRVAVERLVRPRLVGHDAVAHVTLVAVRAGDIPPARRCDQGLAWVVR